MKVALINGSPKVKNSSSECILQGLKSMLPNEYHISEYHFGTTHITNQDLEEITGCDVMVFAFPLYVDGIPGHLVSCLYQMEMFFNTKVFNRIKVYAIVNCGFYEGEQNSIALDMVKNWCEKTNLNWNGGIGVGGGGMFPTLKGVPDGQGPKKKLWEVLKVMNDSIWTETAMNNIFISPSFPRFIYKFAAEMGWCKQVEANGLKRKDLFIRK